MTAPDAPAPPATLEARVRVRGLVRDLRESEPRYATAYEASIARLERLKCADALAALLNGGENG